MAKENIRVVKFPDRIGKISEVTEIKHWNDLFGTTVKMDNGDTFGVWSEDRYVAEMYVVGATLVYELKKIITNPGAQGETIKFRLGRSHFVVPRAERYELYVPERISEAPAIAAKLAAEMVGNDTDKFVAAADMVMDWLHSKILSMQFTLEETFIDTKKILENAEQAAQSNESISGGGGTPGKDDVGAGPKRRKKLGGRKTTVPEG